MSAPFLTWRTVTPSNDPRYMVKGYVLSSAIYGPQSRFLIEEVRAYPNGYDEPDLRYRVRDAAQVSDAEICEGKGSPIAHFAETLDDALAWCDSELVDD